MKIKDLLSEVIITFVLAFAATSIVGYIYRLLVNKQDSFDWSTPVRYGLIFAIILPWIHYKEKKKNGNIKK